MAAMNPPINPSEKEFAAFADGRAFAPLVFRAANDGVLAWTETIAAMSKADIAQAYECGPGATLTGLARRIHDAPSHAALARSEDLDGLQNN